MKDDPARAPEIVSAALLLWLDSEEPEIEEVEDMTCSEKPNSCRFCAGSKFC